MAEYLTSALGNNTLLKTYTSPQELVSCSDISFNSLLYFLPAVIQAGLLYPDFQHYRLGRWLRLGLMPLSVYFSVKLPVDYCFKPHSRRGYPNLALACVSFSLATKAIEWGLMKSFEDGKLWKRAEFDNNGSSSPASNTQNPTKEPKPSPDRQSHRFSFLDWLGWTLELGSSTRGLQYGWGPKVAPNTESLIDTIKRLYKVNVVHVFATAFSILCRDLGSPRNALQHFGLPEIYGFNLLAEILANVAFGFYLVTMTELSYGYATLLAHLMNFVHDHCLQLPAWLMRSFNLKHYVPLYNQPHKSKSLAILWGKAWHQNFRQSFLIVGGFPASTLAKSLRLGSNFQRLAGLWGCFIASAFLHEYAIHFIARPPHSNPHFLFQEFPGSLVYFLLQPIGIMIEPFIIPLIPGGGAVWTWLFTLLTVTPFRRQYFQGFRIVDEGYPSVTWKWFLTAFLIPCSTSRP